MVTRVCRAIVSSSTALALVLVSGWASGDQLYRITDLGTLGGRITYVGGVNRFGQVAGQSTLVELEPFSVFLWSDGVMKDLGNLGGEVFVEDINGVGQITGRVSFAGSGRSHAFLWDGSAMRDLGTLGGVWAKAEDMNASGQVTGWSTLVSDASRAFLWDGSEMRDLGTLGGTESGGVAINASGQVTGSATTAAGDRHAFLWDGFTMRDLGTLGGKNSYAEAINAAGQVVGLSETASGQLHAFLWNQTKIKDLGTLGGDYSRAYVVNGSGQVAGEANNALGKTHVFLWDGNTMRDLGSIAGLQPTVRAMNRSGQVVGYMTRDFYPDIAFLSSNAAPIQNLHKLIDPSDPLKSCIQLKEAVDINDRGQIAAHGDNDCTEPVFPTNRGFLLTPLEYTVVFTAPVAASRWKLGSTVKVKVALVNGNGARIRDSRAITLANACQVKFSAAGAQKKSAACMKYDETANVFHFNWQLDATDIGSTTLKVAATYKFSMPQTITTSKKRAITII